MAGFKFIFQVLSESVYVGIVSSVVCVCVWCAHMHTTHTKHLYTYKYMHTQQAKQSLQIRAWRFTFEHLLINIWKFEAFVSPHLCLSFIFF